MRKAKRFIKNTILLTGTSVLMRLMSMGFQVYLTKCIGSEGIGLFELLMSVYGFATAIAISGVRLSTTRLVLEIDPNCPAGRGRTMGVCLGYAACIGGMAACLLFLLSKPLAEHWLDMPELASCLRILAFSLPCLSIGSCLGGFFSAKRQAGRIAGVQVLEVLFHMILTFCAMRYFRPSTPVTACLLLVCCGCFSDIFSVVLSWFIYRASPKTAEKKRKLLGKLCAIALPDAVGSWIRSALISAKHILIPKGLRQCGATSAQALTSYGVIQGMVMPVLSFPAAFLGTVSGLLIPEIAECNACGQIKRLEEIMRRVLHFTVLFSVFTAGVLMIYGSELGILIYGSDRAAHYIRLLAPLVPLMYLDTVIDGMLKGLGLQNTSMRINILDAMISLLLVWKLIPRVGMSGYLLTFYVSEVLNLMLSYRQLHHTVGLTLPFNRSFFVPILSAACGLLLPHVLLPALCAARPVMAIMVSMVCYYAALRCLRGITQADLIWIGGIFQKA